ncbi:trypsin-like peptidase domain-containing protein [Verrucomicrobiota bacterium sgz303538]
MEPSIDDSAGAIAPDWHSILTWAWVRFRYDLGEQSLGAGAVCLGVGTLALALSRWPIVFWLPWFGAAIVAAIILLRRQRAEHGLLLLVGVVCIPFISAALRPKAAVLPDRAVVEEANITGEPSAPPAIPATVAVVRETTPKPVVEPLPVIPVPEPPSLPAPATPQLTALEAPRQPAPLPPEPSQTAPEQAPATQPEGPGFIQRTFDLLSKVKGTSNEQASSKLPEKPSEQLSPAPATAANFQPETPSTGSETAASGDLVQSHTNAFVLIKGRDSSGSGFICRVGSQAWLFTNIHVMAGMQQPQFTTLDGASVALGGADAAAGHDIMRFALSKSPAQPLEAMTDIANNVRIDDEVEVLGNSGGGGVVTSIKGKVVGIGPDRIEVSAEFIPGNSGSPIVHVKSGKVIGVATYLTKRYEEFANGSPSAPPDTNRPPQSTPPPRSGFAPPRPPVPPSSPRGSQSGAMVVRRFAYRIDSVRAWEPVNWAVFRQESEQVRQISRLTEDVIGFLGAIRNRQEPSFLTDTLRRPASQWFTSISSQRLSAADRLRATEGFLRTLRSMVRADVTAAEASLRYSYFRDDLRNEREVRDRLYEAFDTQAKRMASPTERFTR